MDIEDALKLNLGDKVLVEAEVTTLGAYQGTSGNNIALKLNHYDGGYTLANVSPESIYRLHKKRHIFEKGDIVIFDGACYEVAEKENNNRVIIKNNEISLDALFSCLVLVCPASIRYDKI